MSVAVAVRSVFGRYGAAYTLRQAADGIGANAWTAAPGAISYATCIAREVQDSRAGVRSGETEALIVIDAASCSAAPKRGDRIALGSHGADAGAEWRQITHVDFRRENGFALTYRCTVRR